MDQLERKHFHRLSECKSSCHFSFLTSVILLSAVLTVDLFEHLIAQSPVHYQLFVLTLQCPNEKGKHWFPISLRLLLYYIDEILNDKYIVVFMGIRF